MRVSRRAFLQLSSAAALASRSTRIFAARTDSANADLCRKLASDPLRPQYHLMPAHNWMNDPNGPIFYRGRYHMFHQYNPQAAVWGNMNWAHATSPDLIHWQHEPIAISPTPDGYDRDGVFSGSAVLDDGKPVMIYTGVLPPTNDAEATLRDGVHTWREVQCLAIAADDDLRTFKKYPQPIIATPPAGLPVTGFRDPYVWREGGNWMLIVGSGFYNHGGAILLYSSSDLRQWTYLHPLVQGHGNGEKGANPVDTGEMWECPDFFQLGDKHVLLISTMGLVRWKVGTYANHIFRPEREGVVDWGAYYAAKTMLDKDGNRILWGWIPEKRPDADLIAAGWAGAMSLPRIMSLSANDDLQTDVAPAARMLRGKHVGLNPQDSASTHAKILDTLPLQDLAGEFQFEIRPKGAECTLRLQANSGANSGNDPAFATITILNKSESREIRVNDVTAPLAGRPGSPVRLHMFLDGSVLELFANKTTALTARLYKISAAPLRLTLEGDAELTSFDMWQMKPISKDRLTGSLCP
ncbi:MAG TPA: glycoside hydrolase family 32 protein [Candidatus Solibacter sp.]|nr:glycoside hydrolase family 32 protein [Candidatus Solibacter sp.]